MSVKPQTSDFDWSRTSANRSRIRLANVNGSLFNNDLIHNTNDNSTEKKANCNYFSSVLIEALVNQLMLLLHQLLHEMKTVQSHCRLYLMNNRRLKLLPVRF